MKTLAPRFVQLFHQLSRIFELIRHPRRSGSYFRMPQLFLTPAPVRSVVRQDSQRLHAAQPRRRQE
jgi:hypothetical protein